MQSAMRDAILINCDDRRELRTWQQVLSFFVKLMQMYTAHLRQKKEEDYDYENEERRHP